MVWVFAVTLMAIDNSGGGSKALAGSYGIVHPVNIPKPQSSLEGYDIVIGNSLRGVQAVEADSLAGRDVVVVPSQLKWATTEVILIRIAWIFMASLAILSLCYFFNVAEICKPEQTTGSPLLQNIFKLTRYLLVYFRYTMYI